MLEAVTYSASVALFSFVVLATPRLRHEPLMMLACIPPVFFALIMGFIMAIYLGDNYGTPLAMAALLLPGVAVWWLGRIYGARDLLICIYLAWALGMVFALLGFQFPDLE
ncbi:MAG: hypothetical protein AB7F35_14120 [Acetobacteraceae bacterium]